MSTYGNEKINEFVIIDKEEKEKKTGKSCKSMKLPLHDKADNEDANAQEQGRTNCNKKKDSNNNVTSKPNFLKFKNMSTAKLDRNISNTNTKSTSNMNLNKEEIGKESLIREPNIREPNIESKLKEQNIRETIFKEQVINCNSTITDNIDKEKANKIGITSYKNVSKFATPLEQLIQVHAQDNNENLKDLNDNENDVDNNGMFNKTNIIKTNTIITISGNNFDTQNFDLNKIINTFHSRESPSESKVNIRRNDFRNGNLEGFIKALLNQNALLDLNRANKFPAELSFLQDIMQHETAVPNDRETSSLFLKYKVSEFITMFFTLIAIISGIFQYEFKLFREQAESIKGSATTEEVEVLCLNIITATNVLFIITSVLRYIQFVHLKRALRDFSKADNLCNTGLWWHLTLEVTAAVVNPNAFCKDVYFVTNPSYYMLRVRYSVNDYLMIVLLCRVYVFLRFLISSSRFYDERAERVTKMFGGDLSRIFALRCILNVNPFTFLSIFSISVTLLFAYLIKIIEGPVYELYFDSRLELNDFRYIINCIWYVLVTMTTAGFGDYFPKTNLGRLIGILSAFTGTIFVSILIIFLQQTLKLSIVERKTFDFVERLAHKDHIKANASYFFLHTFKYLVAKNKFLTQLKSKVKNKKRLKRLKRALKKCMYNKLALKKSFRKKIQ